MDILQKKLYKLPKAKYQINSQLIAKNDVFFALKGEKTDGHLYLEDVFNKGASAAIIDKKLKSLKVKDLCFQVDNTLDFLQKHAKFVLEMEQKRLNKYPIKIGITGSMGKTTTKEFISIL